MASKSKEGFEMSLGGEGGKVDLREGSRGRGSWACRTRRGICEGDVVEVDGRECEAEAIEESDTYGRRGASVPVFCFLISSERARFLRVHDKAEELQVELDSWDGASRRA